EAVESLSVPKKRAAHKVIPGSCIIRAKQLADERTDAITSLGPFARLFSPMGRLAHRLGVKESMALQDEYKRALEKLALDQKKEAERQDARKRAREIEAKERAEIKAKLKKEKEEKEKADKDAAANKEKPDPTAAAPAAAAATDGAKKADD